jgi:alkanesulfonate monooxygenase SsuD/methylene tetrahydromethanopterin reductase-like flavin-dependent oxidoreductase (luciferase family)
MVRTTGSGPTKTLRTTARHADIWNGYGTPDRIAATSEILRERCAEVGRPFEAIQRTVSIHGVIRDTAIDARAAWLEVSRVHGLEGRVGSDGTERGLTVGGPVQDVAAVIDAYQRVGVSEVIFVFRAPFDSETINRIGEVRAPL